MKTAFLFDAGFFLPRLQTIHGDQTAEQVVAILADMCREHLRLLGRTEQQLYRIFVYDSPPSAKKLEFPVSRKPYDLSKTPVYKFRRAFHEQLKRQRKVALRLGTLNDKSTQWIIRPERMMALVRGRIQVADLKDEDFKLDVKQKGVDMRIGLDIAFLSSRRLVDQIVLAAGDSDFIPAAKAARREGVDFVLDSMGAPIPIDLHEHIDGLQTVLRPLEPPHHLYLPGIR